MRRVGLWLLLLAAQASAAPPAEEEVAYLLNFVASSGCEFYRNGSFHESADAADHLRMKYQRGKRWIDSAEQFIDRVASGSSISGKPYRVSCEGVEMKSGDWLHQALDQYRKAGLQP